MDPLLAAVHGNVNLPRRRGSVSGGATRIPSWRQRSSRKWWASSDSNSSPAAGKVLPVALASAGRNSSVS